MAGKEKNFENRIKRFLDSIGAYYFKFFANAYTRAGIPDLCVCLNGTFVAIEVKAENGRPSDLQKINLKKINDSGGVGILAYPSGYEDLKEFLYGVNLNYITDKGFDKNKGYHTFKRGRL